HMSGQRANTLLVLVTGLLLGPSSRASVKPSITLTSPVGGEHWSAASQHFLTWKADQLRADFDVKITFSTDGGKKWAVITEKTHFPCSCDKEGWSSRDGARWTLKKPNTFLDQTFDAGRDWEGRHTAGYVVFKDKLWIVGGDVNQGHYHFDVWRSADGKTWEWVNKRQKVPWGPRALHYTVVFRDKIWVLGGQTVPQYAPGDEVFYRDAWTSADGVRWEKVTPK